MLVVVLTDLIGLIIQHGVVVDDRDLVEGGLAAGEWPAAASVIELPATDKPTAVTRRVSLTAVPVPISAQVTDRARLRQASASSTSIVVAPGARFS